MLARVNKQLRATKGKKTCAKLCLGSGLCQVVSEWNQSGILCQVVSGWRAWQVHPQDSAGRWRGEDAVRQLERRGGLCRLHCWQSWKSFRKDVGSRCFVRTSHPARRQGGTGCRQGGQGKVFVGACPAVRPGVGRGYCGPKVTILFFPGPCRRTKAVPPFGPASFIDTLCARIWNLSRLKSTLRGLSWWQGLPYSISRLILLPWIQTASVRV